MEIRIDGVPIGPSARPYIIAELSANHNNSLESAKQLIVEAKRNGASAVKIQTYTPGCLTIDSQKPDFKISSGLWKGKTLHQLYSTASTPWSWHKEMFEVAKDVGISMFSSPFSAAAVNLLEDLDCPAYKIASFEIGDLELIRVAAETKKPLIISTGLASRREIQEALAQVERHGSGEVALLHCVSCYPSNPEDYRLGTIEQLRSDFNRIVGLSDHTIGNLTAVAAIALGASIVEKHFTLDSKGDGPDDSFSMEPPGLADLRSQADLVHASMGSRNYAILDCERESMKYKRSIYFVRPLASGQKIRESDVKVIRPGYGLAPRELQNVVGKVVKDSVEIGTPVTKDVLADG